MNTPHLLFPGTTIRFLSMNFFMVPAGTVMTKVLVAYATKRGSTAEIAAAIGRELRQAGCEADVAKMGQVVSLAGYDAVVIGAPVYTGKVLGDVGTFAARFKEQLKKIPVAGFVAGIAPVYPKAGEVAGFTGQLAGILDEIPLIAVTMFAGALDPARLSFLERGMTSLFRVPTGDFRDWDAVAAFARGLPPLLTRGTAG